jgi:PAS domain S-box-containing protein
MSVTLFENSLGLRRIYDLEGVLRFINPTAAKALWYNPEDVGGRNPRQFLVDRPDSNF